jgi:hypothetical protein
LLPLFVTWCPAPSNFRKQICTRLGGLVLIMNKQCPSCQPIKYRRHLPGLKLCNYRGLIKLALAQVLCDKFGHSKPGKCWHCVGVWRSTTNCHNFVPWFAYSASLLCKLLR